MRISRLIIFITFLLAPLVARADLEESRSALSGLAQKVKMYTLPNGLRVIFYRRGDAPVFAGTVTVRVGGSDEVEGETGISHMFEHMAFKGTHTLGTKDYSREKPLLDELEIFEAKRVRGEKFSPQEESRYTEVNKELTSLWVTGEFAQQYEEQGGVGMNATTDSERTRYFVELPRKAFEFWCAIESMRLREPVMRQFYKERDIVMEERRMRVEDDPPSKLFELLVGVAYLQHRYRNPVIGYSPDIRTLTASKVEAFRRAYYVPNNIVLSLVGDVDPERDIETVRKYFGEIAPAAAVVRPGLVEPAQSGERMVKFEAEANPEVYLAYHKPNYPHRDDAPITVLSHILAGTQIAPLYTELVKKRQVAAAIDVEEGPGMAYPNLLMFSLVPRSPHTNDEVIAAFDEVLKRSIQKSLTLEALQIAKRSIAVDYIGQLKSNTTLALDLASSELFYGRWQAIVDWYEQAMKVSVEDLQRVAAQYIVRTNRTVGVLESKGK